MLLPVSLMAQVKFPLYEDVVKQFFIKYQEPAAESGIKFEKHLDGWHIGLYAYIINTSGGYTENTERKTDDYLFWSAATQKYQPLDFEAVDGTYLDGIKKHKLYDEYEEMYYRIFPCYGYPGSTLDVVSYYKNTPPQTDTAWYCLGRANSHIASNFVRRFKENSMTLLDVNEYKKHEYAAIEAFKKVHELNPNFETIVGDIGTKLANEYMTLYLDLSIYYNQAEALKELPDNIYKPFLINNAKNFLTSCMPNAILFTNGDNDTYPLVYVQAKLNFRPDILVTNISLLNIPAYINRLRMPYLSAQPIKFSYTNKQAESKKTEVAVIADTDNDNKLELGKVLEGVMDERKVKDFSGIKYPLIGGTNFYIKQGNDEIAFNVDRNVLYRNELFILDILNQSEFKRPVYFAITVGVDTYLGLEEYFKLEGLTYRVSTTATDEAESQPGEVVSDVMYNNLMNKFEWGGIENLGESETRMCANYRNNFSRLAKKLFEEGQKDKSLKVLDKCIAVMPDSIVKFDYYTVPLAELYCELNKKDIGESILIKVYKNLPNTNDKNEKMRNDAIKNRIKVIATRFNLKKVLQLVKD